jgi:hypothetical protein
MLRMSLLTSCSKISAAKKNTTSICSTPQPSSQPSGSSSTTAPSQTTYSTTTSGLLLNYRAEPTDHIFSLDAPCDTAKQIFPQSGNAFSIYCNKDVGNGGYAAQTGLNNERLIIIDILGTIAYSIADCVQGCASYNRYLARWKWGDQPGMCRSVTFNPNVTTSITANGGNCFLKNGTVSDEKSLYDQLGAISAMMIQS